MRKCIILFILLLFPSFAYNEAPFIEDTILIVIYDEQDPIVTTKYDVEHGSALGKKSLKDLEIDALICRDARNLNVTIPDDVVEKMVDQILKQNHLSQEQLSIVLTNEKHTLEEFKEDLRKMQMVNTMLDFRVTSRVVISYDDIIAFYNQNPEIEEATYLLQTAFIPFSEQNSPEKQKAKIQQSFHTLAWTDAFWVKKSELAESKAFITTAQIDEPIIEEQANGFMVYKVIEKRENVLVPLHNRYESIVNTLRKPVEEKLMAEYQKELVDKALIVHFEIK